MFRRTSGIPVLAVLQNRDFRILWGARTVHEVSRRMELLALGYLILQLTDSAFQVGLISVFLNAPRPFLSLFAGLVADRLNRRHILVGVHTIYFVITAILLSLLITDNIQPWQVFIAILVQGSAKVLDDPSRRTVIFDLAGQERIASAMSLETITNNCGKIVGPLVAGVLIAGTGFTGVFAVLVALDLVCMLLLFLLRLPNSVPSRGPAPSVWRGLVEGVRHSVSNRMVLGVLWMSLIMNALVFPIQYFIPVIAEDLLKVGPTLGGLLGSAEGIGTLIGACIIAPRRNIRYHGRLFVIGALAVALAVTLVAWSPWFIVSFSLLLLGGVGQAGFSTMQSSILLLASQPDLRGRVMGSQGLVNGVGHLLGGTEIGAVAGAFGISLAIGLNAGAGLLMFVPVVLFTPLMWQQLGTVSQRTQTRRGVDHRPLSNSPPQGGED